MLRLALGVLALAGCAHGVATTSTTPAPPVAQATVTGRVIRGAEHVQFPSRDGDLTHGAPTQLDAYLFRPDTPGPHAAIILLHGCAGLFAKTGELTARHRDWAERLVGLGYVVVMPDSFGPRGYDEICSKDQRPIRPGYERARDVYGAMEWLEARPDVDPARIALFGWSNGGSTVLNAIAAQSRARPKDLAHDARVAIAFYPGCEKVLERRDWLPTIAPLHVLIGAADDWTAAAPCQELVDRARAAGSTADIVVYPGAYHDFDDPIMKVHTRSNVATTASHTATIGMDPAARADAIDRVTRLLADALR